MFSLRSILTVTALSAVLVLSGCSGSDDPPKSDSSGPSADELASASEAAKQQFDLKCDVKVDATGAVEASWEGDGTVSNGGGVAVYQAVDGDSQIAIYAGNDDDIPLSANITVDGATYSTQDPEDPGLDVAADGSSAQIDVDTLGVDGEGPHVTATFTCGKGKGKS